MGRTHWLVEKDSNRSTEEILVISVGRVELRGVMGVRPVLVLSVVQLVLAGRELLSPRVGVVLGLGKVPLVALGDLLTSAFAADGAIKYLAPHETKIRAKGIFSINPS
jgi:hypothetical protein